MTLQEQIERSFGDGPEQPPLDLTLAAGHRALRRRRIGAAVAAAAAVVVVGTGATLAVTHDTTGSRGRRRPDRHRRRSSRPCGTSTRSATAGSPRATPRTGTVQLRGRHPRSSSASTTRWACGPQGDSVGLVVERAGTAVAAPDRDADGSTAVAHDPPRRTGSTFDAWLADLVADLQKQMARNERHQRELAARAPRRVRRRARPWSS